MKRILVIPVNYNSYAELDEYLLSLKDSFISAASEQVEIIVIVGDNSTEVQRIETAKYAPLEISVKKFDNLGYFGAALKIINEQENIESFDYVIISNVDIFYQEAFIKSLADYDIPSNIGWISPFRYSLTYKQPLFSGTKDRRASRLKIKALQYYFMCPAIVKARWDRLKKKRAEIPPEAVYKEREIYSGCGSCFILTKSFFKQYKHIYYPVFLYGEEIFIAELCRLANLKVFYAPGLKINEIGGISTGKVNIKRICKFNLEGLIYNYNSFYRGQKL